MISQTIPPNIVPQLGTVLLCYSVGSSVWPIDCIDDSRRKGLDARVVIEMAMTTAMKRHLIVACQPTTATDEPRR